MEAIIGTTGVLMLTIAGNLASFLIIWHFAKSDIKEYLNGKK